jgi:hypothetical protein
MNSIKRSWLVVTGLLLVLALGIFFSLRPKEPVGLTPASTVDESISHESLKALEQFQNQGDVQEAPGD